MEITEKIKKFTDELAKLSPGKAMVEITPYRGETTVFSSKFGGVPYFPKDMEYPTVSEGEFAGKPIRFLAQLNFAEVPHMEGFPESGILQFFVGCDGHDVYGLDFDDPISQNTFRVIYHENIVTDESLLYTEEDVPEFDGDDFPFEGEFALDFSEPESRTVPMEDYQFSDYACEVYNRAFGKSVKTIFEEDNIEAGDSIEADDPEFYDALFDGGDDYDELMYHICCDSSHIGGYPFFTQTDPREYGVGYRKYDTVLLQIDTEEEIMWGDSGVANFFISAEDLAKKDFSRVLYNWDCC